MKMTRCIFIDSENQTIKNDVMVGDTLSELQKRVQGHVDVVRVTDKADLWVDDEGLLKSPKFFFKWEGYEMLAGNGVITGHDNEGNTIDTPLTLDEVKKKVKFAIAF